MLVLFPEDDLLDENVAGKIGSDGGALRWRLA
jgi:hypothetical protein